MTEQGLALNLAVFGSGVTSAIKHSGNHFAFIAISREDVLHLNTIKVYRDTLATGFDAFTRIVVENCQAHMASNKKAPLLRGSLFLCLPDIGLIPVALAQRR
ncbi:TPA: hypothetical protein MNB21_004439 [Klebsiella pneumoniae]|uniref:hypothetical protein n=1 Tax=Klebsiella pneumoniae TaxID=573 RepID=UPI0013E3D4B4|nr:hypothetical protein [Klebsiella pneumoniae]HBZ9287964.1 hypothetical protein [Klebsiella pneumoniae]HCA1935272.1 hypothetical protein [Klebsiella pneumoniae]HCA2089234.1 hypothetical protein [Klebsiella pneumoniae]